MGTVDITYLNLDANGDCGAELYDVKSVLVDTANRTMSVLVDGEEHYFNMNNIQSIEAKGVKITYA